MGSTSRFAHLRSVSSRSFPPNLAKLMLLGCAMLWGGSYLFAKVAMNEITPQWLMAIRTFGAALVMLLLFRTRITRYLNRRIVVPALIVGATYFVSLTLQIGGLRLIDPGRSAFLSAGYCVLVPFAAWIILRQKATTRNVAAALICLVGVGFVSLKAGFTGFAFSLGDWMTVGNAAAYALNIVFLSVYSKRFHPLAMTFVEFVVSGCGFLVSALIWEPAPDVGWLQPYVIGSMLYLVLGATMLGQVLQNIGVAHVPPSQAGIIMCTESVFSVLLSAAFYGERITVTSMIGFALIFVAVVISQIRPVRRLRLRGRRPGKRGDSLTYDIADTVDACL